MAMKNGQSLNKRDPGIAHNTAVASVPCVTSQHLSALSSLRHTSSHQPGPPPSPSSVTSFMDVPKDKI